MKKGISFFLIAIIAMFLFNGCEAPEKSDAEVILGILHKAQWYYHYNEGEKTFATTAKELVDAKALQEEFIKLDTREGVKIGDYVYHMVNVKSNKNFAFTATPILSGLKRYSINLTGVILEDN